MDNSILLETGIGELEVIVFTVNNNKYCINVLKSKEIMYLNEVRDTANVHPSIIGITDVRGKVMTVIDLSYILDQKKTELKDKNKMALICEFNSKEVIFVVDSIVGIRRIKWADIKQPDTLLKGSYSVGNILTESGIVLLLDFERIVSMLNTEKNEYAVSKEKITHDAKRSMKKIFVAEDSPVILNILKDVLNQAGYMQLTLFENGQDALGAIMDIRKEYGRNYHEKIDLLITDIEMPALDGHTLTRRIKEDSIINELPVIIFSSLITEDLFHKGAKVGANEQISKPDIEELVSAVDRLVLNKD